MGDGGVRNLGVALRYLKREKFGLSFLIRTQFLDSHSGSNSFQSSAYVCLRLPSLIRGDCSPRSEGKSFESQPLELVGPM